MKLNVVRTSVLAENCYILEKNNKYLIVDPGADFNLIKDEIKGELLGVLITHGHFDHIGALEKIVKEYNCPVYKYEDLQEQEYKVGPFTFNVVFNPGHSKDSVTYYFIKEKKMFVGDFIFEGNIGRCDLPGGNYDEMMKSITKIKEYPNETAIYPGHGGFTTLGHEKMNNYYFNI